MKSFENYSVKQRLGNGFSQWEKRYDDGQTALACVEDAHCTRALVCAAFQAQEKNMDYGTVFTRKDAEFYGLAVQCPASTAEQAVPSLGLQGQEFQMSTPKSELMRKMREERKKQGMERLEIWAPKDKHEAIKKAAERITSGR